jgi:hypothetical protein
MNQGDPLSPCAVCTVLIPATASVCPHCKAPQPGKQPTTDLEVLVHVGVGAFVVGGVIGALAGGFFGGIGAKGWGDLYGIFIGQDGVGARWFQNVVPYSATIGGLIGAILWAVVMVLEVRRLLKERSK